MSSLAKPTIFYLIEVNGYLPPSPANLINIPLSLQSRGDKPQKLILSQKLNGKNIKTLSHKNPLLVKL